MKYKIGDTVRVKDNLIPGFIYFSKEYVGTTLFFAHEMKAFCGKIGKVIKIVEYNGLYPERYIVSDFLKWPAFDLTDCPSIAHFSVRQRFNDTGADAPVQSNHFSR